MRETLTSTEGSFTERPWTGEVNREFVGSLREREDLSRMLEQACDDAEASQVS